MTCKDCIGYKFCSRGRNGQTNFYGKDVACNNVDILCNDFKNKADFVEVVRCSECRHKVDYCGRIMCGRMMYRFNTGVGGLVATKPEHFCGYGERNALKEGAGDGEVV